MILDKYIHALYKYIRITYSTYIQNLQSDYLFLLTGWYCSRIQSTSCDRWPGRICSFLRTTYTSFCALNSPAAARCWPSESRSYGNKYIFMYVCMYVCMYVYIDVYTMCACLALKKWRSISEYKTNTCILYYDKILTVCMYVRSR